MKLWTGNIIVAVIISILIEMIVPEGNNKKYIKVISGLYILYVIVNPILKLDGKFGFKNEIKNVVIDAGSVSFSEQNVAESYILSLENSLKEKIENNFGKIVNYVQFYITPDYSDIVKIEIKMKLGSSFDEQMVRNCVLEDYVIDSQNIIID